MYQRVISAASLVEFQNIIQAGITYVTTEPTEGQWTYNNALNAVKVNANRGYFRFYLGKLTFGDKINIKAEVFNISGVKVHSSVDIGSTSYDASLAVSGLVSTQKTSDWEIINNNYHVDKEGLVSVVIGLSTGEIGQYYLRNVVITIESIYPSPLQTTPFRKVVGACIRKETVFFAYDSAFKNNACYISQYDSNTLRIVFSDLTEYANLTKSTGYCMGWTSEEWYNNTYFIRAKASGVDTIDIQFRDPTTNAIIPLSSVANPTSFVVFAMI